MKRIVIAIVIIIVIAVSSVVVYANSNNVDKLEIINYQLKDKYNSYAEVADDKMQFFEYKEKYFSDMNAYLSKIFRTRGNEYKKEIENKLQFESTALAIEEKFNEQLATFTPTETDILKSKEDMLNYYVQLIYYSQPKEMINDSGEKAKNILDDYNNRKITVDDAMFGSGCVEFLKKSSKKRFENDNSYKHLLSRFNMSTWFDIDDYIEAYKYS